MKTRLGWLSSKVHRTDGNWLGLASVFNALRHGHETDDPLPNPWWHIYGIPMFMGMVVLLGWCIFH
jgi:hypothetical protein